MSEVIQIEKLIEMILALGLIQFVGAIFSRKLSSHLGFIFSGFVNGLVSSTAFTASLAKRSQNLSETQIKVESISFLSATLAMLVQAAFLVFIGIDNISSKILFIFVTPIVATLLLMGFRAYKIKSIETEFPKVPFLDVASLVKLTFFVVGIVTISRLLQSKFGDQGLSLVTFIVSFFEIHGSVIANTQLASNGSILLSEYYFLLALSLATSYLGKLIIVWSLGHRYLKKRITLWVSVLSISIFFGYYIGKWIG